MSDWQPIDSAPKDGTIFQGCDWEPLEGLIYATFTLTWDRQSKCWRYLRPGFGWYEFPEDGPPTHWQLLPPPPHGLEREKK